DGLSASSEEFKNYKFLQAKIFEKFGYFYTIQGKFQYASGYYLKAMKIYENNKLGEEMYSCLQILGIIYMQQGDYSNALKYYGKALKIKQNELSRFPGNKIVIEEFSDMIFCFGIVFHYQGNYPDALKYYLKALKIKEALKDIDGICQLYNNMGIIYEKQKNYALALDYYDKSLKLAQETGDKKNASNCLGNIGLVYEYQKDYIKALTYHQRALKINEELNDIAGISYCLSNIGGILKEQKQYSSAIDNYQSALKILEEIGDKRGVAANYNSLSEIYLIMKDYKNAVKYAEKSLLISENIGALPEQANSYEILTSAYDRLNNLKDALKYHKLLKLADDSIFSSEKSEQIVQMEAIYQNEKKQLQIEKLNKEKELQLIENKKQKITIISFVVGFVFILFVLILLYILFVQKKRANILLTRKNAEIQVKNEEIQTQAEEIKSINEQLLLANEELEKLSIVARETDNAVAIMDNSTNFLWINEGFTRLYEMTLDELINKFGTNLFAATQNPDTIEIIKRCINEKITVHYESAMITKSERKIWTQTTLTPIPGKHGNIEMFIAIDTDISRIKAAEQGIREQNKIIQQKNLLITDSINYAQKIQQAILPSESKLKKYFKDSFILYLPKDIVSGDFYWATTVHVSDVVTGSHGVVSGTMPASHPVTDADALTDDFIFFAVVDCTGHGVPGGFMSMIGNSLLNEIVNVKRILQPSAILKELDINVKRALQQNEQSDRDDGMAVSLFCYELQSRKLKITCANQIVLLYIDEELRKIEGGIYSVGDQLTSKRKLEFYENTFTLSDGAIIYFFSDGYFDRTIL
ncbi:MAG: tetratricopeptide repeat protein, partial [Bacteroidia bacterium]|nr:tetratricopeptide repeat protein [Bacteroidia bacterium]